MGCEWRKASRGEERDEEKDRERRMRGGRWLEGLGG